jgi:uncharacterized protein
MDRAALAARIQEILKNRRAGQASPPVGRDGQVSAPPLARDSKLDLSDEEAAFARRCASAEASSRVLEVLGAVLLDDPAGASVVVDRFYPLTHRHGHHEVSRYHQAVRASAGHALPSFLAKTPIPETSIEPPLLFFDLETTGLSGGAGTYAFLVGFGYFGEEGFHTRQFFLRGYGEERALLHAVTREITGRRDACPTDSERDAGPTDSEPDAGPTDSEPDAGPTDSERDACPTDSERDAGPPVLVTYNGRSFDVPLIETRYQFNRLRSPFDALAHVDMLFAARRLWKRRHDQAPGPRPRASGLSGAPGLRPQAPGQYSDDAPGSCALTAIERDILGLHRHDDVPGWEIPARYFGYARTGDARGLEAVLEHNRLDLISLGAVSAVILEMVAEGADAVRERPECLALGRLLDSLGRLEEAERCYRAAADFDGLHDTDVDRYVRADALHWLALHRRRARRFHEAAEAWEQLAGIPGIDAERKREALEALAIHHEHREKDLEAARAFAKSALELTSDARRVDEVRHRLGRLSRKLTTTSPRAETLRLDRS